MRESEAREHRPRRKALRTACSPRRALHSEDGPSIAMAAAGGAGKGTETLGWGESGPGGPRPRRECLWVRHRGWTAGHPSLTVGFPVSVPDCPLARHGRHGQRCFAFTESVSRAEGTVLATLSRDGCRPAGRWGSVLSGRAPGHFQRCPWRRAAGSAAEMGTAPGAQSRPAGGPGTQQPCAGLATLPWKPRERKVTLLSSVTVSQGPHPWNLVRLW